MPAVSVLDLTPVAAGRGEASAVRESIELARAADRLGYRRIWFAEHHNGGMVASSAPELMIAAAGAVTSRIRLGSGGMMLPNHTPLHVAEQFKLLEALYPGRIDLGIGRAPGTDFRTALALRGGREVGGADLPEMLAELLSFAGLRERPAGHPFAPVKAAPDDAPLPPIYLLGSSDFSARLAAASGLGFAFAAQINPDDAVGTLRAYRDEFQPSDLLSKPAAILAHNVICAESDEEAQRLAAPARVAFRNLRSGNPQPLPSAEEAAGEDRPQRTPANGIEGMRMIVGTGTGVREILDELVSRSGADEAMLMGSTHALEDRIRSYELLAAAYGLKGDSGGAEPLSAAATSSA